MQANDPDNQTERLSLFQSSVLGAVRAVPAGHIVSYGQIAAYIGMPRAARQVGWALASIGAGAGDFPWWRVVNKDGHISINNPQVSPQNQKALLEAESVEVDELFRIDIKRYGFDLLTNAESLSSEDQQRLRLTGDTYFD